MRVNLIWEAFRCANEDIDAIIAELLTIVRCTLRSVSDYKLPLASCSLSIASNRLLKFPAPNPSKLFR